MRPQGWFATRVTYSRGISFGVLGALEVRLDGESLPLGGAKQRAVLAVLLLSANEVISVERLIDEVWAIAPRRLRPTASRRTSRAFGSC